MTTKSNFPNPTRPGLDAGKFAVFLAERSDDEIRTAFQNVWGAGPDGIRRYSVGRYKGLALAGPIADRWPFA